MVTNEINKLKCWFDKNKLSLNLNNTEIMLFGNCKININVKKEIDNVMIVYENEFLVVVLDHKLCWKPHIKYLCSKMARRIGILGKTRHITEL